MEADLEIDGALSVSDAHRLAPDAEGRLVGQVPRLAGAVIHAYPILGAVRSE
jgi:divalent metal cation (Fe/Co/Zn/Cd) transporter